MGGIVWLSMIKAVLTLGVFDQAFVYSFFVHCEEKVNKERKQEKV